MELPKIRYISLFNRIDYSQRFQGWYFDESTGQIQQDSHGPCYLDQRKQKIELRTFVPVNKDGSENGVWLNTLDENGKLVKILQEK